MSSGGEIEAEVRQAFAAQLTAMTRRDTATLDALLADGFALTHLSGYTQPKREWLSQLASADFIYHQLTVRGVDVDADADGGDVAGAEADAGADVDSGASSPRPRGAVLVGRLLADVTVHGRRGRWRLQLTQHHTRNLDGWTVDHCTASTW